MMWKQRWGDAALLALKMEEGPRVKECWHLWRLDKAEKQVLWVLQRNAAV